jgi:hypothetical protein
MYGTQIYRMRNSYVRDSETGASDGEALSKSYAPCGAKEE